MQNFETALQKHGIPYQKGVSFSSLTTFRIGGETAYLLRPRSCSALTAAIRICRDHEIPFLILGRGSNVLARDERFSGAVISTLSVNDVSYDGQYVNADCGLLLSALSSFLLQKSLGGFENLSGIPGTVGGAALMNAGAYGTSFCDFIESVSVYHVDEDRESEYPFFVCGFGYRQSRFQNENTLITSVRLRFSPSRYDIIRARMEDIQRQRQEKQPLDYPSAGSAFRRPVGCSAAYLISQAGLTGARSGGASVSTKHTGFIINEGEATGADVRSLLSYIITTVEQKSGIRLEPEYIIL